MRLGCKSVVKKWQEGVNIMDDSVAIEAIGSDAVILQDVPVEVIYGTGADRIAFLHRLLSGRVGSTEPGHGCHTLLLDMKGHVQSDIELLAAQNAVVLFVSHGEGATTAAALNRYAIMDDFVAAAQPEVATLAVLGPSAALALAKAGLEVPASVSEGPLYAHAALLGPWNGLSIVRRPALGGPGFRIWGGRALVDKLESTLRAAGTPSLPHPLAESLRVAAGEPRFGFDITPNRFPMEVGLDDAIDETKGCYLGQEPIVRIRDRGHVNWSLRRLTFDPLGPLPQVGDKLESDQRPAAGHLTSVALVPARGEGAARGVALGLVHRSVGDEILRVLTAAGPVPAHVLAPKPV